MTDLLRTFFKHISNSDLLHILENPNQYQKSAIESAKVEFANRQLSDAELNDAKELLCSVVEKEAGEVISVNGSASDR
jgi:hypothetical protein